MFLAACLDLSRAAQLLHVLRHLADPPLVLAAAGALTRLLGAAPAATAAALAACDALRLLAAAAEWQQRAEQVLPPLLSFSCSKGPSMTRHSHGVAMAQRGGLEQLGVVSARIRWLT